MLEVDGRSGGRVDTRSSGFTRVSSGDSWAAGRLALGAVGSELTGRGRRL